MGIDVEIFFKANDKFNGYVYLPDDYEWRDVGRNNKPEGATHYISTFDRFYGPEYARGTWPRICAALMSLLACEGVEKVWYFGDCDDPEGEQPITIYDVLTLSKFYMENGNQPYYRRLEK